ncbi:Failed axon connections -like protein [Toxocara canis]|uniref:Failed axon connections-like protein n=2 Tax=Toxocara canis TaxID=6265 RepID=A0A0B2VEB9_TOXCA|nr:Failed axon connections -like protein [Toxocara canis]VDM44417.1 unnamed protein product [Toxocara canis]
MSGESFKEQLLTFYDELPPWGKAAAAGALALTVYIPYKCYTSLPRKSPLKEDFKKGVVYLYQFPRVKCIPNLSPFCLKLETWMRMADIPYENVPCGWNVRSCEGTLPFVELDGVEHPDSALAIRDLTEVFSKETMESHLNEEQRAASRAFEAMVESSLMFSVARIRYVERLDEVFKQFPENAFGILTPIIAWFMKRSVGSRAMSVLKTVGIGKHSREEVIYIGNEDLKAVSHYLGSKHYFTGFKPTRVDATLFSVLAQIVYAPYELPQKTLIMDELTNLKEYCDRIRGRYWPDWEECTTKFTISSEWKKKA